MKLIIYTLEDPKDALANLEPRPEFISTIMKLSPSVVDSVLFVTICSLPVNNNKFPRIEVRIRSKNDPLIENIIKNDSDNQDIHINNEFEKKGEENKFQQNDVDNENLSNKMKNNDGNKFNPVEEMIKNNYQNNNQGEIMEVNNDENEYNDFE